MEKELQIKSSVTIEMIGDPDRFPEAFEVKLTDEELEEAIKHINGSDALYFSITGTDEDAKSAAEQLKTNLENPDTRERIIEISKNKAALEKSIQELVAKYNDLVK
jgi:hypothetical protein